MMDVSANTIFPSPVRAQDRPGANPTQQTTEQTKTLDYNSFLKLLIAQLQYQDPTEPMDPTEHVSQLASFSAVEQQVRANAKLDSLLTAFSLSQAEGVIGRTLTSPGGDISGKVTGVRIIEGGAVAMLDNGKEITLGAGVVIT
jgi:flagellar basal-body rod modification protein FlgD